LRIDPVEGTGESLIGGARVPMASFSDGKSENPAVVFVIKVVIYDSGPSSYISSSGKKKVFHSGFTCSPSLIPVCYSSSQRRTANFFYQVFFFFFFHLNATVH
jgi:hypothetical protein